MRDILKALSSAKACDVRRAALLSILATGISLIVPTIAAAQAINLDLGSGGGLTDRVVQLVGLLTVLSLAPSIVMMTTSFVRIVVVLSLLRTALGLTQSPPNAVITSLALFLTAIIMGPTFSPVLRRRHQAALGAQNGIAASFWRRQPAGEAVHAEPGGPRRPWPVHPPFQDPDAPRRRWTRRFRW